MAEKAELKKHLGIVELSFFGIGAVIGTGIFVIPALVAGVAGIASFFVWLELGVLTIFMALCIAELASTHPDAGGPYVFVKEAFGRAAGFFTGWTGWILSWVTIASLAVATSYYLTYFFPWLTGTMKIVLGIFLIWLVTFVNFRGLHWGIKAQFILTTITILVLWMYITWGVYWIRIEHFIKPSHVVGLSEMIAASVLVIEPFIGWETLTYFAEDAKNPARDMPRAIIYTSIIVTLMYSAVIFVTLGLIPPEILAASEYPLALASEVFLGPTGALVIAIGGVAILVGCLNSWIVGTSRLPYAMARDGLFPEVFSHIHGAHGTPQKALVLQAVFASIVVASGGFEWIIHLLVGFAMIMYLGAFISIPFHRRSGKPIPFKIPLGNLVAAIASALALFMLTRLAVHDLMLVVGAILLGIPVYLYMQRKKK